MLTTETYRAVAARRRGCLFKLARAPVSCRHTCTINNTEADTKEYFVTDSRYLLKKTRNVFSSYSEEINLI
jgi:hypothetical protein